MNIKSLLLGSAAALAAVSGAQAADAIVAAEPEPMEYVRVCDAFGAGYFYIPGSETCLKVGGRVRFDANYGNAYNVSRGGEGTFTNTRAEIYMQSASDTEFGALKTNMTARFDYNPHNATSAGGRFPDSTRTRLMVATIELGGFTVGLQDSLYEQLLGYAGNVINDDVINYGPSEVNQIAYTYKADAFTAFIALEDDGQNKNDTPLSPKDSANSDFPNVSGGVKFDNGTFLAGVTAGYDESIQEGAVKARLGFKTGGFNAFVMGGWNTDGNSYNSYAPGTNYGSGIGTIGWGDWALWAGGGYKFSSKLATNLQVAYTDSDIFEATANLQWTPAAGFLVQPEVTYTSVKTGSIDEDQWEGIVRFQRTF
jgi:opacity protein-like surface antigen